MDDPNHLDVRIAGLLVGCRTHPLGGIEMHFCNATDHWQVANVLPDGPTPAQLAAFFAGLASAAARVGKGG